MLCGQLFQPNFRSDQRYRQKIIHVFHVVAHAVSFAAVLTFRANIVGVRGHYVNRSEGARRNAGPPRHRRALGDKMRTVKPTRGAVRGGPTRPSFRYGKPGPRQGGVQSPPLEWTHTALGSRHTHSSAPPITAQTLWKCPALFSESENQIEEAANSCPVGRDCLP
jgi:hypothetical protein